MQFHLIIIFCFLFFNFPLAQTNNINSSMPSLMPFQSSPNSKPIMHIGAIEENENMRFLTGIQFSPAKNLLIGGVISPLKAQSDLSIYYHLAIGFKTKWKLLNTASNMFQIGMHRNRFENGEDKNWVSLSVTESGHIGKFNFDVCANHLVSSIKEENTLMMSTNITIKNFIYLRPGMIAHLKPSFIYNSFLLISMQI